MSTPAVCLIPTSTYFHATHSSVQQWQRLTATHVCSSRACVLPFVHTSTASAAAVEAPAACCNGRPLQLIVNRLCNNPTLVWSGPPLLIAFAAQCWTDGIQVPQVLLVVLCCNVLCSRLSYSSSQSVSMQPVYLL
jgi:hypothetical protein